MHEERTDTQTDGHITHMCMEKIELNTIEQRTQYLCQP